MQTRTIVITSQDLDRLRQLIHHTRELRTENDEYLRALEQELGQAQIVKADAVPPDVVTMNSTAVVRAEGSRRAQTWTVVYPEDADMDEGRISVLEPLGTALLGYRAGDSLEWDVPAGRRRYEITKVIHQPEAAGEFDR
ncbi:MAG: nucleoside diphosphate kinase regulator [Phycisphaeraceae bacterium]|nr:nucleoside diphosphate kinase regulator [Phycisphaeraceae bacterium]